MVDLTKILVASDLSPRADLALQRAVLLAAKHHARNSRCCTWWTRDHPSRSYTGCFLK